MLKLLSAILILLSVGVILARGQPREAALLSDGDKSQIIESVLELELRTQLSVPDFANIRKVSSDNIDFVEPSKISKLGFTLVAASYLRESKTIRVVKYLLFRKIFLRDDVAVVLLSRVTEGRPCFGAAFSHERSYTYESRRTDSGWITQLTRKPTPFDFIRAETFRYHALNLAAKPNKSFEPEREQRASHRETFALTKFRPRPVNSTVGALCCVRTGSGSDPIKANLST